MSKIDIKLAPLKKQISGMKKVLLSLSLLALTTSVSFAQDKQDPAQSATVQNPDALKFTDEIHDFGTIPQNIPAETEFTFKNTGKEPIILSRVQPSCGCTSPTWSKDPILPGKTGTIKATYNAAAPGNFQKSITVFANVGTKVLTIKGNVEKAPEGSVPENNSVIKTH